MTAVVLGHAPFALLALAVAPLPAPQAWPYVIAGALLHLGYQAFLLMAYRLGDLTQVYPIARGAAPLIVAAVSVGFLGVALTGVERTAVLLIAGGVMSLVLVRRGDGLRNRRAGAAALATGGFIAAYSLVDGFGARAAGTAMGYFAAAALLNAALFAPIMALWRPGTLRRTVREEAETALLGGGASFVAYTLVVWGFTQAPIALVTALRETSVVFALLIGVFGLGERLSLAKLAATAATLAGAVLLRAAR